MNNAKMTAEQKRIALAAFPGYRGRKFNVRAVRTYTLDDYWDGGSRTYVKAVDLATGRVGEPSAMVHNPMNGAAHAQFEIPAGVALIEHSVFCGKDCGLTFVVGEAPAIGAVRA